MYEYAFHLLLFNIVGIRGVDPSCHTVAWVVAWRPGGGLTSLLRWQKCEGHVWDTRTSTSDAGERSSDSQRDLIPTCKNYHFSQIGPWISQHQTNSYIYSTKCQRLLDQYCIENCHLLIRNGNVDYKMILKLCDLTSQVVCNLSQWTLYLQWLCLQWGR